MQKKNSPILEFCSELVERSFEFAFMHQIMQWLPAYAALEDIPIGSDICIYGFGKAGRTLYEKIRVNREDVSFSYFIDSSSSGEKEGFQIKKIFDISKEELQTKIVLIASVFWKDILRVLSEKIDVRQIRIFNSISTHKHALVIPEYKLIFVPVPKTSTTIISTSLLESTGILSSRVLAHKFYQWVDLRSPEFSDYWKFSFVRHPWQRLYSLYNRLTSGDIKLEMKCINYLMGKSPINQNPDFDTFAEFVEQNSDIVADYHWRSQHTFLHDSEGTPLVDFIGKFENLREDFLHVREQVNANIPLLHLNVSPKPAVNNGLPPWQVWSSKSDRYAKDRSLFGYKK